jgi:hypothetical protein
MIHPGSKVTIRTPRGQEVTGTAIMKNRTIEAWVLDTGRGGSATALATPDNVIGGDKTRNAKTPVIATTKKIYDALINGGIDDLINALKNSDNALDWTATGIRSLGLDNIAIYQNESDWDRLWYALFGFAGERGVMSNLYSTYRSDGGSLTAPQKKAIVAKIDNALRIAANRMNASFRRAIGGK